MLSCFIFFQLKGRFIMNICRSFFLSWIFKRRILHKPHICTRRIKESLKHILNIVICADLIILYLVNCRCSVRRTTMRKCSRCSMVIWENLRAALFLHVPSFCHHALLPLNLVRTTVETLSSIRLKCSWTRSVFRFRIGKGIKF